MAFVIVDTDILIDVMRGVSDAVNCLKRLEQQSPRATLVISVVTQMELMVGCQNKTELQKTENFLQSFPVLHIKETISGQAVQLLRQYRLSHGLLIPDALIAATALDCNGPLITKNQRDFRFIANLKLLPYP